MRTVESALYDVGVQQRAVDDSGSGAYQFTEEQLEMLGNRCVRDAVDPRTCDQRYAESVLLAALCYAKVEHLRELRANNWNEPRTNVMDGGDDWPPDDRTPAQVEADNARTKAGGE